MDSFSEAWSVICDYCKTRITDVAYKTWFSRIEPVNIDFNTGEAVLLVPNDFHKLTLTKCYVPLLNEAVSQVFGPDFHVKLTVPENSGPPPANAYSPIYGFDAINPHPMPDEEKKEDKKQEEEQNTVAGAKTGNELTFDNFIVGSSNKFAHAASQAVASQPATTYNPLFIYGNSGLGKTHLLYAIGNEIKKDHPSMKVQYVKGDDFTNELIESLRRGSMIEFRQKYRKADVLLVDDVQFIGGKESTQEEFFHTFNTLYESQKQIVLTSDRSPREIKTLEDRIRNRFEWGLLADIQPPDIETRIAIIRRKAEMLNFDIPADICEYIATKLKTNIRQIEGVVKKLKAQNFIAGEKITITVANEAIKDVVDGPSEIPQPLTVEKVIEEVSRTYSVTPENIRSLKNKKANLAHARQVAIYIVREITHLPMTKIGEEFGGRHYSTIVYTIKQVEAEMEEDPILKQTVQDIINNIREN